VAGLVLFAVFTFGKLHAGPLHSQTQGTSRFSLAKKQIKLKAQEKTHTFHFCESFSPFIRVQRWWLGHEFRSSPKVLIDNSYRNLKKKGRLSYRKKWPNYPNVYFQKYNLERCAHRHLKIDHSNT
jgi:hypothetical protein